MVSVIIPTLNSSRTLRGCLESVRIQRYDGDVQVIIADGGSTDDTVKIAEEYGCLVVENRLKTGEAGKARGLKEASGEIVALIDSDNILPDERWMLRMVEPFASEEIVGSEPLEYTLRKSDSLLTRYCALMGMNDPLCYFLGNYDRYCVLSGRWTGFDIPFCDRGGYLEISVKTDALPTMGANGFLVRKSALDELGIGDYLFDIDVMHDLVARGNSRFAKVKTGIVHLYGSGLETFARKQLRRVRDYQYYSSLEMRHYPWSKQRKLGVVKFTIYCLLVIPLVLQAIKGYARKPDVAWALHVPACLVTFFVYAWGSVEGIIKPREQDRGGWRQ